MLILLLRLFWTFFTIGLFGFGGGYAMISMIQSEVVTHYQWLSSGEFADIVAISQSTPGPIGINSATYVGYSSVVNAGYSPLWGVVGSLVASFAVVLPSFVLMILISKFFLRYRSHQKVEHVFLGLRPAVVGLLAAAALMLMNKENFGDIQQTPWHFWISIAIFCFAFISQRVYRMSPILIIVLSGLAGLLLL